MTLRPGSKEAQLLFGCEPVDVDKWQCCFNAYNAAVAAVAGGKSKSDLVAWDHFLWKELSSQASERTPTHLTLSELAEVMKWKLARGKARPLQKLLESNTNSAVVQASTEALKQLEKGSWEGAIAALTTLKAVGVATATAVLAPFAPADIPFMADEVVEAVSCKRDYTMKVYKQVRTALIRKADELSSCAVEGSTHVVWTAEEVGKALWTRAIMAVYPGVASAGAAHERHEVVSPASPKGSAKRKQPASGNEVGVKLQSSETVNAADTVSSDAAPAAAAGVNKRKR
jgi:hypothetical protein